MVCTVSNTTMAYRGAARQASVVSIGQATDGVPVKISDKLHPPPLVDLPRNFQIGNPSEVLFMEYDFRLEEKVIQTAEVQRRYREAFEARAEAERQAQEAAAEEAAKEAAASAATVGEDGDAEESTDAQEDAAKSEQSVPAVPVRAAQPQDVQSLFLNLGAGSILMPTPIVQPQPKGMKTPTRAPGSGFNLADFENAQDPFENLELKTLNDMEELNKVLQGAQTTVADNSQMNSSQSISQVVSQGVQNIQSSQQPTVPNGHAVQVQNFSHQNLKDVDYPDIDSINVSDVSDVNVQMQTASFYNHNAVRPNMYSRHSAAGGQYYPNNSNYSNNGYMPNLPQVTRDNFTKSSPLPPIDSNAYSQSGATVPGLGMPVNSSFMSQNKQGVSANSTYYALNGYTSGAAEPSTLRSSRSTPDITSMEETMSRPIPPTSHTPPPYQYGSRSRSGSQSNSRPNSRPGSRPSSPPPRPSTQQDWNKYSILPSTPPRTSSGESNMKTATTQLPDVYNSLSHEAQRLANSISDMGFRRARVARAVQKLGQDERKVLDHLCAVNRIHEQGFPQEDAEVAMHQFEQNEEKSLQYLKLLGQFKELGFSVEKIQGALISADLNENKALDMLTST